MTDAPQGRVLSQPQPEHHCNPGWEARHHDANIVLSAGYYMHDLNLPVGTVWECPCGQVWIHDDWAGWRREKRRERKRRLRKEGAIDG